MDCKEFVKRWIAKADATALDNLAGYFDKFTTLFTIYNKLYSEAAFVLNREGAIKLNAKAHIPDAKSATNYIAVFLGEAEMKRLLDHNECSRCDCWNGSHY